MEKQTALTLGQDLQQHYENTVVVLKSKVSLENYNDVPFVNTSFSFLYFHSIEEVADYIYDRIYKETDKNGFVIRYSLTNNEIKLFNSDKEFWINFKFFDNIIFQNVQTALNLKLSKIPNKYKLEQAPISPPSKKKKHCKL